MKLLVLAPILALCAAPGTSAPAQQSLLPNGSFEQGTGGAPTGWTLQGKGGWATTGAHTGHRCLMVEGSGTDSGYWSTSVGALQPNKLYQLSFWYKGADDATGGLVISGPSFANEDYNYSSEWQKATYVFHTPPKIPAGSYLRFGQWMAKGRLYFDDVRLVPAEVVNQHFGDIVLGDGEKIDGDSYTFDADSTGYANAYFRPVASYDCAWNSYRWVFAPGSYVIYKQEIPGASQKSATVDVNVNYYSSGTCVIEASPDGRSWRQIGKIGAQGGGHYDLPADMFPARVVWVRILSPGELERRADSAPGSFQVNGYTYHATLDRDLGTMEGHSTYVAFDTQSPEVPVRIADLAGGPGRNTARLEVTNKTGKAARVRGIVLVTKVGGSTMSFSGEAKVPAGQSAEVKVPWEVLDAGQYNLAFQVDAAGATVAAGQAGSFNVPVIDDASFGYPISSDATTDLWWCEGAWKVGRDRVAPAGSPREMTVSAARAEFEPVQLVLRPKREIRDLRVRVGSFRGDGHNLPASILSVKQVVYVHVTHPTDAAGGAGWWPDPVPPVTGPLEAPAGINLPLWLTVHVPRDATPGDYESTITLTAAGGWHASVPLHLHVWAFAIPEQVHVTTALGLSQGPIWQYQNLNGPGDAADRAKVWDLYMQDWRDHHISPYSFALHPWTVSITGVTWNGGEVVSDNPHDGGQCMKVVDNSTTGNASADYAKRLAIQPGRAYLLRFWARTATDGQQLMVSLGQYDGSGQWLTGNNIDTAETGTKAWKEYDVRLPANRFNTRTRSVSLSLRPDAWADNGSTMGTTWYDDLYFGLADGVQNMLQDPGFEAGVNQVKVKVDFSQWDKEAAKYLNGYHFTSFDIPIMGLGGGRYPNYDWGHFGPFAFGTPGYERLMGSYLMQIQNHLQAKGWLKKGFIYWYDEPGTQDYPFVVAHNKMLKRLAPKLARMLTEQPGTELEGHVDIWCPVLSMYVPKICHQMQADGNTVWWYICTGPKAPFLGEFIDHPHTDMRAWLWETWKWRVQGCLIWATDWWNVPALFGAKYQNPWQDPESYTSDSKPGAVGYWGNGDGRFLYPPNRKAWQDKTTKFVQGPVDSIRWDMFRDGIDDYEYLWTLRDLIQEGRGTEAARRQAAKLLVIPDTICGPKVQDYNHKPTALLERRRQVAQAIERLMK